MNSKIKQDKDRADFLFNEKKYNEAISLYSSILDEKDELNDEEISDINQVLGRCYFLNYNSLESKKYFSEAYKIRESLLGKEDAKTLISAEWLAAAHSNLKEWNEAKKIFRSLLEIRRKVSKNDSKLIFRTLIGLVKINGAFDVFEEQKELLTEAVTLADKIFEVNSDEAMDAKFRLVKLFYDNSDHQSAVSLLKKMYADYSEEYEDDETTLKILRSLGDNYYFIGGKQNETEYYFNEAIRIHNDIEQPIDYNFVKMYYRLGKSLLYESKNYVEAIKAYKVVIDNCDEFLARDSWMRINAYSELGEAYYEGQKELEKAEENLGKALSVIKSSDKDYSKKIVRINYYLAKILIDSDKRDQAEKLLKETIELSKSVNGLNDDATNTLIGFQYKQFPTSKYSRELAVESRTSLSTSNDYNDYVKEAFKSENINKKIRVFISSTFRDMMQEREYLMKNVFPKLRKLCREKGYDFTEVDLRWGITEEDAEKGKVIEICLNEIDKSRPFFIGMIGERYGWIPEIEDSRDFKKMLNNFEWLSKDIQEELSVTEMEIQYGVLRNPAMKGNAFFYLRDQSLSPDNPDFVEKKDSREYKKLIRLKDNLKKQQDFPVKDYSSIEVLGDSIFEDLKFAIFGKEESVQKASEISEARDKQLNFIKSLCDFYIPDKKLFKVVDKFIKKGSLGLKKKSNKLIIYGDKGEGRSALLANYIKMYYSDGKDKKTPIFFHFVEADPDNKNSGNIIKRIIREINMYSNTGVDFQDVNNQNPAPILEEVFRKAEKEIIIIIDGLEKIKTLEFFSKLFWLPENISQNVRIIITTNNEEIFDAVDVGYDWVFSNQLTESQSKMFIEKYLDKFGKKLTKNQVEDIVMDEIALNPFSLKLVLDELRIFGVFEELDNFIENYLDAENEVELFSRLLERLEKDYNVENEGLIGKILSLLALTKNGILENEIIDFAETAPVYWSPIYNSIENYLYRNLGQLSVSNEDFAEAIRKRYLNDPEIVKSIHSRMADYFQGLDDVDRKYNELSFHLFEMGEWERLKDHVSDIEIFLKYYKNDPQEFTFYWNELRNHYNFADTYKKAFEDYEKNTSTIPTDLIFAADRISTMLGLEANTEDSAFFAEKSLKLAEMVYGDQHLETARIISKYVTSLYNRKEFSKAEDYALKAIEIFESNSDTSSKHASLLSTLANVYLAQDKLDLSEEYIEKAYEILKGIWGEDSFAIAAGPYIQLAHVNLKKQNFERALNYCKSSVSIFERYGGTDHMIMFTALDSMVEIYMTMDLLDEALEAIDKSLENKMLAFGENHVMVFVSFMSMATVLFRKEEYQQAEEISRENFEKCKSFLGLEHKLTQGFLKLLISCYSWLEDKESEEKYRKI